MELLLKIISDKHQIKLPYHLLKKYSFDEGVLVKTSFNQGALELVALEAGLDTYRTHVASLRKQKQLLLQVHKHKTKRLIIPPAYLKRHNYFIGDVVLIQFAQGLIVIKKLDLVKLGFEDNMIFKIMTVHKNAIKGKTPPFIQLQGKWLINAGFTIGTSAMLSYSNNGQAILFTPHHEPTRKVQKYGFPPQANILFRKYKNMAEPTPTLFLRGQWLQNAGYEHGDFLLIGYKQALIHLRKVDLVKLI